MFNFALIDASFLQKVYQSQRLSMDYDKLISFGQTNPSNIKIHVGNQSDAFKSMLMAKKFQLFYESDFEIETTLAIMRGDIFKVLEHSPTVQVHLIGDLQRFETVIKHMSHPRLHYKIYDQIQVDYLSVAEMSLPKNCSLSLIQHYPPLTLVSNKESV